MSQADLDRVLQLLGPETYLVPCEVGSKKPAVTWKLRSLEETRGEGYRQLLSLSNIAVRLGRTSGGLVAIDFDEDDRVMEWDLVNGHLGRTLRSRGARGCQVWLRIRGEYPPSETVRGFYEWRADDRLSTIVGTHPSGVQYQWTIPNAPLEVEFKEIVWPDGWPLPWLETELQEIQDAYGRCVLVGSNGGVTFNQSALCARFAKEFPILFDKQSGQFYLYVEDTGLWTALDKDTATSMVRRNLIQQLRDLEIANGESVYKVAISRITQNMVEQISRMLQGEIGHSDPFAKRAPKVVHVANGMIDLREQPFAFQKFDQKYFSRNQIPIPWHAEARCDRFLNELLKTALADEDIETLQRWCGMAILGRNLAQMILILSGGAGTGKSTIASIIKLMIGVKNIAQLRTEHLDERFELAQYYGKSLLIGSDVRENFLNQSSAHVLKALTGGDPISGEIKGKTGQVALVGHYNVLITANTRLTVKLHGDTAAWARRLIIVQFDQPPPEQPIIGFDELLVEEEGSGILNWMVEGAQKVLATKRNPIPLTDHQFSRVQDLLSESDAARKFISDCVRRSKFPIDYITTDSLYTAYLEYCDVRGWRSDTRRNWEMKCSDLMEQIHKTTSCSIWVENEQMKKYLKGYRYVTLQTEDLHKNEP